MKRKIKCSYCSYEWETKSTKIWVTCPNCQRKTKLVRRKNENENENENESNSNKGH